METSEVVRIRTFVQRNVAMPLDFIGDKFDAFILAAQMTFDAITSIPGLCIEKEEEDGQVEKTTPAGEDAVPGDKSKPVQLRLKTSRTK